VGGKKGGGDLPRTLQWQCDITIYFIRGDGSRSRFIYFCSVHIFLPPSVIVIYISPLPLSKPPVGGLKLQVGGGLAAQLPLEAQRGLLNAASTN